MNWSNAMSLEKVAESIGVELRGDDGQPYRCGERMNVGAGICGPDIATCKMCGVQLVNMASPHINGGYLPNPKTQEVITGETWCAKIPKKERKRNGKN